MATSCTSVREAPSAAFATSAVTVTRDRTVGTQIIGRDPQRRTVTIIADPDNTGDLYIVADPTVPSTGGVRLKPGAGLTLATVAAVYALAPTADCLVYAVAETGVQG